MGIHQRWINGDRELPTIGWKSPVRGPVHPAFVDLGEPSGLGWLDGFDEFFVRCGLESNGAPDFDAKTGRLAYPLHGRIANRPAHEVAADGRYREAGNLAPRRRRRNAVSFFEAAADVDDHDEIRQQLVHVRDEIENFSALPATMQMLYHINFGLPLLDAGSRVVAPVKTLVPRTPHAASGIKTWDSYSAPQPGFDEMVYFFELNADDDGTTRTLLKNAHATRGVSLVFNKQQLPWFTLWKDTAARARRLCHGPGAGHELSQSAYVLRPPKSASSSSRRARSKSLKSASKSTARPPKLPLRKPRSPKIQAGRQPKIFDQPQADWRAHYTYGAYSACVSMYFSTARGVR